MTQYLIFYDDNFEPIRKQLNEMFGLPKKGEQNGKEVNHGMTTDYITTFPHPTEQKGFIIKTNDLPLLVEESANEILTEQEMEAQGWFKEV